MGKRNRLNHDSKTGNKGAEKAQQLEAWRTWKSARPENNRGGYRRGYPDDNELYLSINSAEYGIGQSIRYLHQLQNIYFDLIGKELKI